MSQPLRGSMEGSAWPHSSSRWSSTYIHEFDHPPVVIHFHPHRKDGGTFSLEQVREALAKGVNAIELDLRYRKRDGVAVCDHDRARRSSPTLSEVLELLARHADGSNTVNNDGCQFFLTLEPKEDSLALFDAITAALQANEALLSTAVNQDDGPRPITAILTGSFRRQCLGHLYERSAVEANRVLLCEDVDYRGMIKQLGAVERAPSFQWTALRYDAGVPRGRINALHLGQDSELSGPFNVRVWNTGTEQALRMALASGADAINCNLSQIELARQILRSQQPLALSPSLNLVGQNALLTWQGQSRKGVLYLAKGSAGSDGLSFGRQLNLTDFLDGAPTGVSLAGHWIDENEILLVSERFASARSGDAASLGYISGLFSREDRFISFLGRQRALSLPKGIGWRGRSPAVAITASGRIVVLYTGTDRKKKLWYFSGLLTPAGELVGTESPLHDAQHCRGVAPSIDVDPQDRVLIAYESADGAPELRYYCGAIDGLGRITGVDRPLSAASDASGRSPHVGFGPEGTVVLAYASTEPAAIRYITGTVADGQLFGKEFVLTQATGAPGAPTLDFDQDGNIFVVYADREDFTLRCVHGRVGSRGQIVGENRIIDMQL